MMIWVTSYLMPFELLILGMLFCYLWEGKQKVSDDCFTCHSQYSLVDCGMTLLQQNQKYDQKISRLVARSEDKNRMDMAKRFTVFTASPEVIFRFHKSQDYLTII